VIAAGARNQGKFGRITVDMYRMVQLMEWQIDMKEKGEHPSLNDTFVSKKSNVYGSRFLSRTTLSEEFMHFG
jgi:hypothetical protein